MFTESYQVTLKFHFKFSPRRTENFDTPNIDMNVHTTDIQDREEPVTLQFISTE